MKRKIAFGLLIGWVLLMTLAPACSAQMARTIEKHTIGGRTFNCLHYAPKNPSNNWLVWLPGKGELDATDVSKMDLFDASGKPVTWTAQAKMGFEFPFHILAIQLPPAFDYWAVQNSVAIYVKETLKAAEIGITGYSLGGRGAWYCLQGDSKHYINFIAPVCGYYDFSQGPISNLETVPVFSIHGDQDATMSYQQDVATAAAYNVGRQNQIFDGKAYPADILVTLQGMGHNVWPNAYDVTPGKDGLLQWVLQQFGPGQPVADPIINTTFDGVNVIITTQSGKKISIKPLSVE